MTVGFLEIMSKTLDLLSLFYFAEDASDEDDADDECHNKGATFDDEAV